MTKVILASTSKYRQALFKRLAIPFSSIAPNVDEDKFKQEFNNLTELTRVLAKAKANEVFNKHPDKIVIGSDQAVGFENQIFSKPGSKQKALSQLLELSGKTHKLVTSVCIKSADKEIIFSHETRLKMKSLEPEQIMEYLEIDKPFDCAGSYKIEECGITLFEQIDSTDFNSIIGLPLLETSQILSREFSIHPFKS